MKISRTQLYLAFAAAGAAILLVTLLASPSSLERSNRLNQWLAARPKTLSQAQTVGLSNWLREALVQTHVIDSFSVNPQQLAGELTFVVYDRAIPGVVAAAPFNAAYDEYLDVVFVDRSLALLAFDGRVMNSSDLLLFIILHELGHRQGGHRGLHRAMPRGELEWTGSEVQEVAADQFAIAKMLYLFSKDQLGTGIWRNSILRINSMIEDALLGEYLTGNPTGLSTRDRAHPNLLERTQNFFWVLAHSELIPAVLQRTEQLFYQWAAAAVEDIRRRLAYEVIAPAGELFVRSTDSPVGPALLTSKGRIAVIPGVHSPTARGARVQVVEPQIVAQEIPGVERLQLSSGSEFWFADGAFYLLRPGGVLMRVIPKAGTSRAWEAVGILNELVGHALYIQHQPQATACTSLVSRRGDTVGVSRLDSAGQLAVASKLDAPIQPADPVHGSSQWFYAGANRSGVYFWEASQSANLSRNVAVWELPVPCSEPMPPARPPRIVARFEVAPDEALAGVLPFHSREGFVAISSRDHWRSLDVTIQGLPNAIRVGSMQTYIARRPQSDEISRDAPYILGVSHFRDLYLTEDDRFLVMNGPQAGTFVLDLKTGRLLLRGSVTRESLFSLWLRSHSLLVTTTSRASRALIWNFGNF